MLTLVIPAYTGGENIERTMKSSQAWDEMVIISTAVFEDDHEHFMSLTPKVVRLDWNYVFLHGFGSMSNCGTAAAKNDWLVLLGVAETLAEEHGDLHRRLQDARPHSMFRCDHHGDHHTWKRIWNRRGGTHWSGIIHEEITGGNTDDILFRMQDTPKVATTDEFRQDVFRHIKALTYNWLYSELLLRPERLGATNPGWLNFVNGARESITAFIALHREMMDACILGDLETFLELVRRSREVISPIPAY